MAVLTSDHLSYSILALDTSTQACSVALCYRGEITHSLLNQPREHAKKLLPMVDKLLVDAGIGLAQLDGLSFTAGPGSFTGLRIGMGVIQGLAFGADLPVVPVSTLQTMAQGAVRSRNLAPGAIIMPVLDARMDELYWGLYQQKNSRAEPICDDALAAPELMTKPVTDLVKHIDIGLGDGWQFQQRFGLTADFCDLSVHPDALDVLTLAQPLFTAGQQKSIDDVQLVYLRDKVSWKKHQKLRDQGN